MKIFSFSSGAHDSSYAIYDGNKIISHDELERHTRIKECDGDILEFYSKIGSLDDFDIITTFPHGNGKWYPKGFGDIDKDKFIEVGHHQSHAANAFFSSNLDSALIVTIDGGGWDRVDGNLIPSTITIWRGDGTKITNIGYSNTVNLGMTWQDVTRNVFGMSGGGPPYGCQAGTVMAMAALGDHNSFPELNMINMFAGRINFANYTNLSEQDKFNFAAVLQKHTEEYIVHLIDMYLKPEDKNLCLAGGTVLNSVMTGKLWDRFTSIENIYIPPVPYDAGLALGNIQYIVHHMNNKPRERYIDNITPYLGKTYSKREVDRALDKYSEIKCTIVDDERVIDLLINQNIVSVFNEGSESGRRALGNRSILADPRSDKMKDLINEKVKHRQSFRPFAPSILREKVTDWFVRDVDSPYMQFVIKFKEDKKKEVPAVVHFDGTARLQTVTENDNKWYYNFIKKFENRTKVPILLNTSFNDREPIVETPEHAINCFLKTNIDYLYFSQFNILVSKK
tara:strand:+ start:9026 stop:10552 length:1527 start_codon:yes stop_codon:yes gene_type:complete